MDKTKENVNLPEIHEVKFHDQTLQTFMIDGVEYTAIKPIVEGMGLDWESQYKLIQRDMILSQGISITEIPSKSGIQKTLCLPLKYLNGWLFKINASRYKNKFQQEAIIKYQLECYDVLHNYWKNGAAINPRMSAENIGVGLFDENAKTTNNINYAINGLCKTADQFLGGKAALTALNYFTGMPIDHLLKDLEEKQKEKTEQEVISGQRMRVSHSVRDFINFMCEFRSDAEVKKDEFYNAYSEFCKGNIVRPEPRNLFFKYLLGMKRLVYIHRRGSDGARFWTITGVCLKKEDVVI